MAAIELDTTRVTSAMITLPRSERPDAHYVSEEGAGFLGRLVRLRVATRRARKKFRHRR